MVDVCRRGKPIYNLNNAPRINVLTEAHVQTNSGDWPPTGPAARTAVLPPSAAMNVFPPSSTKPAAGYPRTSRRISGFSC